MDKLYYVVENNEQIGPYSIEELKARNIKGSTLVWKEGFENWVTADNVEELKIILKVTPPPIPKEIIPKIILRTEEPLQFEDSLKKQIIEKNKSQNEAVKKKTAKEIKTIVRFLKYALISGLTSFLIAFGVLGGYQYLYYFIDAGGKNVSKEFEVKYIKDIDSWDKYLILEKEKDEAFDKWSKRLNLYYKFNEKEINSCLNEEHIMNFKEGEYLSIDLDYCFYKDQEGNSVPNPRYFIYKTSEETMMKNREFDEKIKKGEIILKTTMDIRLKINYGKIVMKNLNYAWENALPWGVAFFGIVFPFSYLFLLLYKTFMSSKQWVEQNSLKD